MHTGHKFSLEEDEDIRVFRYLSFDRFKELIERSALFFSRMDLMSDPSEGMLYRRGGENKMVYGNCWRMYDLGNYDKLFKKYKCGEDGVIIETSTVPLRESFRIFARSRHTSLHWGLFFPFVIFAKVNYRNRLGKNFSIYSVEHDTELALSVAMSYNVEEHLAPFLFKTMDYKYERELRIFTRWQSCTLNGPSYLSECAIFKKYTGEIIERRCTCLADILSIEKEIKKSDRLEIEDMDQMQPIGFFYPISLKILKAIYIKHSEEDKIKELLNKSNHSNLSTILRNL